MCRPRRRPAEIRRRRSDDESESITNSQYELSVYRDNLSSDRPGRVHFLVVHLDVALSFEVSPAWSNRGEASRRFRASTDESPSAICALCVCADGYGGARLSRLLGIVRDGALRRKRGIRGLEKQTRPAQPPRGREHAARLDI